MGTAAKVSIQLDAQTATLKKGFGEATGAINRLNGSMSNNVAAGMAKFHVGLAAVKGALGAVRGAVNSVFESMNRLADMADFADRIGVGVEALGALRFAAEQNGSSAGVMDMAMQRLTRRVAQAAAGTGELAKILPQIGLNAQELAALSPDQQMLAFADAIKSAGSRGEQMRITMAAMDTEGVGLVDLLSQGSEGLARWGEEAAKAGIATDKQTRASQRAAAALKKWGAAWSHFKDLFTSLILPILTKAAEMISSVTSAVSGWFEGDNAAKNPLKPLTDGAKKAVTALEPVAKKFEEVKTKVEATKKKTVDLASQLAAVNVGTTPGIGAVTRNTAAGFSAQQSATRSRIDADRRHKEQLRVLNNILAAVRRGTVELAPVAI